MTSLREDKSYSLLWHGGKSKGVQYFLQHDGGDEPAALRVVHAEYPPSSLPLRLLGNQRLFLKRRNHGLISQMFPKKVFAEIDLNGKKI